MTYTEVMAGEDKRAAPRTMVSLMMKCAASTTGTLRLDDISLGGFMARGRIAMNEGDRLEGVVHVHPMSGDRDVSIVGTVVRLIKDGEDSVLGVKIESFDSPEGGEAYRQFAKELNEDS